MTLVKTIKNSRKLRLIIDYMEIDILSAWLLCIFPTKLVRNRQTENEKTVRIFNPFSIRANQYDAIKRVEEVLRAVL